MMGKKQFWIGWLISFLGATAALLFASVELPERRDVSEMVIAVSTPPVSRPAETAPPSDSAPPPPMSKPVAAPSKPSVVAHQPAVTEQVTTSRTVVARQVVQVNAVALSEAVAREALTIQHQSSNGRLRSPGKGLLKDLPLSTAP